MASEFAAAYQALADAGPYRIDGRSIGRRALRNASLAYLAAADPEQGAALAMAQFDAARNMTDVLAALMVLAELDRPQRDMALARFYGLWSDDELLTDKWFALQARSSLPQTPDRVRELTRHPAFERKNPNRVRALVGTFAQANQLCFHDASGAGYAFLADEVIALDPINPTTAARPSSPRLMAPPRTGPPELMRRELERVLATPDLSKNSYDGVEEPSLRFPASSRRRPHQRWTLAVACDEFVACPPEISRPDLRPPARKRLRGATIPATGCTLRKREGAP